MKKALLILMIGVVLLVVILIFAPSKKCELGPKGEKCFCQGAMLANDFCLGIKNYIFVD